MAKRNSLWIMEKYNLFQTRIDYYVDVDGNKSWMKWIPPFRACRALTAAAAVATPSGTVGDWFHPDQIQAAWTLDTDYEIMGMRTVATSGSLVVGKWYTIKTYISDDDFTNVGAPQNVTGQSFCATGTTPTKWTNASVVELEGMGGYWVDMFLASSATATAISAGDMCNGSDTDKKCYISQPGVPPVSSLGSASLTIAHFRDYLKARFDNGDFQNTPTGASWSGKGGLMTDAHWFELWVWTRINRWLLRGNTNGYNAADHVPQWHSDANDIGILDPATSAANGASLTGGGNIFWEVPVSDFCGNRWEFTDGLRLYNAGIYTAGKTINPWTTSTDGYNHASFANTGLSISGVSSTKSIASYRTEVALKRHGIPGSTTSGAGGFDEQGWWYTATDERITLRGGGCNNGARCPGALNSYNAPSSYGWSLCARAVLVP